MSRLKDIECYKEVKYFSALWKEHWEVIWSESSLVGFTAPLEVKLREVTYCIDGDFQCIDREEDPELWEEISEAIREVNG
jgi:hypothetical protein